MSAQSNLQRRRFSPRDEVYLNSTSFEVYMATGGVFVVGFTIAFLAGVLLNFAWLVWPGTFITVVLAYLTLSTLERREFRNKFAELEAEYDQQGRNEA